MLALSVGWAMCRAAGLLAQRLQLPDKCAGASCSLFHKHMCAACTTGPPIMSVHAAMQPHSRFATLSFACWQQAHDHVCHGAGMRRHRTYSASSSGDRSTQMSPEASLATSMSLGTPAMSLGTGTGSLGAQLGDKAAAPPRVLPPGLQRD